MEAVGYFLIFPCFLIMIKGQCWSNGTCECHCVDCNKTCTECSPGWSGSTVNKCQRANTLFQILGENEGNSQTLDGNLNTSVDVFNANPYVRIQLQRSTEIDKIDITLQLRRGAVYTLYVKETEHYRAPDAICDTWIHNDTDTKRTISMICRKPVKGRIIEIVSPNNTELEVFEFQRFECTDGSYGEKCSNMCPTGCDKACDKVSGSCVCRRGFYGTSCKNSCPQSFNERGCNLHTGDCFECKKGFFGNRCEINCSLGCLERCNMTTGYCKCKTGFFKENCSMSCPASCLNNKCDQNTGECLSCSNGYYGSTCNKTCLGKCQSGCEKLTGVCVNCIDNIYGHFCNLTCPQNCAGESCVRNGNCEQCKRGYSGSKCNETCPNNCNWCSQDGYSCGTCKDGYFGVTCAKMCPSSCGGNGSCDIQSGYCQTCSSKLHGNFCEYTCSKYCDSPGKCDQYTGECKSCVPGRYGRKCLNECSANCLNVTCFSNQTCVHGCKDGWFGEQCKHDCSVVTGGCAHCGFIEGNDEVKCLRCEDSWFLNEAECFQCPENCSSCLSNNLCTQCKNNLFYGTMCEKRCHDGCIRNECDVNGKCLYGCSNGKYGTECEQECPKACGYNAYICLESNETKCQLCFSCDCSKNYTSVIRGKNFTIFDKHYKIILIDDAINIQVCQCSFLLKFKHS
ncbi:multiple epidermal growth factor-like domains protein 10 [Saccostrea cucullata]|uniref:multiple epidermal growth factor-like domains protein 10 n=1 Tax=Saccostrea cuccullata TaxID=36930 RepID=UPI002ED32D1A